MTYGAAALETTPVFSATMPNSNNSDILVDRARLSVKMYDARPTSQSLAVDNASSSVSNWNTGAIGPNISSLQTRIS